MESPRKESPPAPASVSNLELSQLDLRYEGYRLRQPRLEERLLPSIAQQGIREALRGVPDASGGSGGAILLDGFKRLRCARKLYLGSVPFAPLGSGQLDEGILQLLRGSGDRHGLSQLEEARFVDELHAVRGLSVGEIAEALSRSKAWVSVRLGLLKALSPVVREALFAGDFPVHSYLYSVRPFKRLKGVGSDDVDRFVQALRGQKFSVRQIDGLAHGFFRGPESFRQEILGGNLKLALRLLQESLPLDPDACTDFERIFLADLEGLQKSMLRVLTKCADPQLGSRPFMAQANLLCSAILGRSAALLQNLRSLHDRSGQA